MFDVGLVIFDCDGVLVDSEPIANRVLSEALNALGITQSQQDCDREYRGLSLRSMFEKIEQHSGQALPADFEQRLQSKTYAAFQQSLRAVPHIESVLQQLSAKNIAFCVASSGSYEKMAVTLGKTKLRQYFSDRIFSSIEVKRGKPYPDLFLLAADKMQIAPRRCVVVEDSPAGIRAALAAHMRVLAYCPGELHGVKVDCVKAEDWQTAIENQKLRIFNNMQELPKLLFG